MYNLLKPFGDDREKALLGDLVNFLSLTQPEGPKREKELDEKLKICDILQADVDITIDEHFLAKAPNLKAIFCTSIGVDYVDLEAAAKRNIIVANNPDFCVLAVAEYAIGLLYAMFRRIPEGTCAVKHGKWDERGMLGGTELFGKSLGIIGFGKTGREVARQALGIGMKVNVKVNTPDPQNKAEQIRQMGANPMTFEEVLRESDVISLHVPLAGETKNLIGRKNRMDWKQIYKEKIVSAKEALSHVKSGDSVVPAHAAAEPQYLINQLLEQKDRLEGVKIVQGLNIGDAPYAAPEYKDSFVNVSFFCGKNNRKCIQEGRGEFLPIHFYAQPRAIREGTLPCDIGLIQVTPPDENGYVNVGTSCDQTRTVIEKARVSIAQVNERMPHLCGDTLIHVSDIDFFVEYDEDIYEIPLISSEDPVAEKIGYNISTLIEDGATLQMGQGTIPNAILKFLEDKKDLGIHTEVFSDNLIPLVQAGIVNGRRKSINRGKIISTFVQGTKELYNYVNNNNMIQLMPVDYTNDVAVIAQNDNMVAINSALEVDLMGQVVADAIGSKTFSGVGGQLDFLRGAEQAKNGKPIIALPSTAKGGEISRISAVLKPGTPVTTTRQDVHYVVTEYGIAYLFGKSIKQRAEALINIAHPKFRDQLREDFKAYCQSAGQIYF